MDEFTEVHLSDLRDDRRAAAIFVRACIAGDGEAVLQNAGNLANTVDGWRCAMRKVGRLSSVSDDVQRAFHNIWVEHKSLPRSVGHRPTMAAALRILMPKSYDGEAMLLYRGAMASERKRRIYGFSWTSQSDVATRFASQWSAKGWDAVVLETLAPASAIHLVREDEGYYDEAEVIVDPFALGVARVHQRIMALKKAET